MARFKQKTRLSPEIPTGTFADISFLLIIFFMVTTTFVVYRGFRVNLPDASRIDAITARRHITNLWIGADGSMMVDEFQVDLSTVGETVRTKLAANPRIIVLIKADRNTPYRVVSRVLDELRRVDARRVSFIALRDQKQ
jgi:biopolymer transport protein ExbD